METALYGRLYERLYERERRVVGEAACAVAATLATDADDREVRFVRGTQVNRERSSPEKTSRP